MHLSLSSHRTIILHYWCYFLAPPLMINNILFISSSLLILVSWLRCIFLKSEICFPMIQLRFSVFTAHALTPIGYISCGVSEVSLSFFFVYTTQILFTIYSLLVFPHAHISVNKSKELWQHCRCRRLYVSEKGVGCN